MCELFAAVLVGEDDGGYASVFELLQPGPAAKRGLSPHAAPDSVRGFLVARQVFPSVQEHERLLYEKIGRYTVAACPVGNGKFAARTLNLPSSRNRAHPGRQARTVDLSPH